jgi:hypothetical protein
VNPRAALLPALAAALVAAVLGVQVAAGGPEFAPHRAADPCAERSVEPVSGGIDGLGEQLVLLGLDGAACRLGTSREELVLRLGGPGERTDAEVDALRGGLRDAVDRLEREDRLPPVSQLAEEALAQADIPELAKSLIRALPDSVIDGRLETAGVLRRTVDSLDIRGLLGDFDDPAQLQARIVAAVTRAAIEEFSDSLPDLPGLPSLADLFGR